MFQKKSITEVDQESLVEPLLNTDEWKDLEEGIRLFNHRLFWHAHEAWERVWKQRPEESRIFFQGIIQLAAAYHLLIVENRYVGMMRNLEKAEAKIRLFTPTFLRIDTSSLLGFIDSTRKEAQRVGQEHLAHFNPAIIPTIVLVTDGSGHHESSDTNH